MMLKIAVLELVKGFPFNYYRILTTYNDVLFITPEFYDGIEYFRLHLKNDFTATYNSTDYKILIMDR